MAEQGLLRDSDLQMILSKGKDDRIHLFDLLVSQNLLSEQKIYDFLKEEYGYSVVDPTQFTISQDVLVLIPKQIAEKNNVLPLFKIDNLLTVATCNPTSIVALDDLRVKQDLKFDIVLSLPEKLSEAIEKNYSEEVVPEVPQEDFEELLNVIEKEDEDIEISDVDQLKQAASETPVIKVANLLIAEAIRKGASDLFIEPWERSVRIRCRIDGILEELKAPPKSMSNGLVSRIKVMSQLDIAERRIPQDGRFKVKMQNREVDIRVSVIPSSFGEKVCLRLLDKTVNVPNLKKLGFDGTQLELVQENCLKPHGMILITGPTGSGKSTTLYAILNMLYSSEKNITTVEDPVEYQINGVNQINVHDSIGLTFSQSLRAILRQDPDIIMIGEIRDGETLDIAIKSALTGHLVLSTLHTNDSVSALVRMTNMGVEPFLISSSVLMISAQRLVRKLCSRCRERFTPDAKTVKRYSLENFEFDKHLYKPIGCNFCSGKGYKGRTLLTEVLSLSPEIRDMILENRGMDVLKKQARKEGMDTLRESGIKKAINGDTSLEEVIRVTAADIEKRTGRE